MSHSLHTLALKVLVFSTSIFLSFCFLFSFVFLSVDYFVLPLQYFFATVTRCGNLSHETSRRGHPTGTLPVCLFFFVSPDTLHVHFRFHLIVSANGVIQSHQTFSHPRKPFHQLHGVTIVANFYLHTKQAGRHFITISLRPLLVLFLREAYSGKRQPRLTK